MAKNPVRLSNMFVVKENGSAIDILVNWIQAGLFILLKFTKASQKPKIWKIEIS